MWQYSRRRRAGHGDAYAYMMAFHTIVQFLQQHRTPPVTLALIAVNVAVHLRPGPLDNLLPTTEQVCLNPSVFLRTMDWRRLILSAFYHSDDTHLIYNMISLLWKGLELESQLGSSRFAATTGALLLLSHGSLVVVSRLASDLLDLHDPFYRECAVGFSAVLFGMKTILNWPQPTFSYVGGMLLPTKYAAWGELLLIQMLVPNASFLGHLCGILAGLLLLHVPPALGASLSALSLGGLLTGAPFRPQRRWGYGVSGRTQDDGSYRRAYGTGRGSVSGPTSTAGVGGHWPPRSHSSEDMSQEDVWACSACTFGNSMDVWSCEMCGSARGSSSSRGLGQASAPPQPASSAPPAPGHGQHPNEHATPATSGNGPLSEEELRMIRISRFSQS